MDLQGITLVSYGSFDSSFLRKIAEAVSSESGLPVNYREAFYDLTEFYNPSRKQYDGMSLLRFVDENHGEDGSKTIGLFNVDIFIPILTFIFGQAYLNGRSAVVSVFRLANEMYGMEKDDNLMILRTIKEVMHELGHTLGLIHCHVPDCVMRQVSYVEDIDQKNYSFCRNCRLKATGR